MARRAATKPTSPAADEPAGGSAEGGEGSDRKRTAVLVFHGMGDQRPMDTLSGLVDAVLGGPGVGKPIKRWVRPYVGATADFDLRSITSETVEASNTRYDFFEFYWAHLMSGTRLVAVILWLCDLAKRDRRRIPADAQWVWHTIVAVFVGALVAAVHLMWVVGFTLVGTDVERLAQRHEAAAVPVGAFILVLGIGAAWFAVARLGKERHVGVTILSVFAVLAFIGWWRGLALLTLVPVLAGLRMFFGGQAALFGLFWLAVAALVVLLWGAFLALIGIGSAAMPSFSWEGAFDVIFLTVQFEPAAVWLLAFLALFGALASIFLVPYVGDCARYLRDAPDNIEARDKIRALGIRVLEDLHQRRDRDATTPRYDRIVVVAHSLGSVIAYDVLRAFYTRSTGSLAAGQEMEAALADIHRLKGARLVSVDAEAAQTPTGIIWKALADTEIRPQVSAVQVGANAADLAEPADPHPGTPVSTLGYQAMQRAAFARFVTAPAATPDKRGADYWRISDFVTMGSPLTHAALLLTRNGKERELAEKVADREFPVAPPVWSKTEKGRVFYHARPVRAARRNGDKGAIRLQHSSMFALTCWTNLYFTQHHALRGDFIGGPIAPDLSPGTLNVPLETTVAGGYFNHVHYWNGSAGETAPHILALRLAVLGEEACRQVDAHRQMVGATPAAPAASTDTTGGSSAPP